MLNAITVTVEDDRATLALAGEHEAYSADKLARHLNGLLEEGVSVIVDLRHTEFLDSAVVGTLLGAARDAQTRDLGLSLLLGADTGWPVRRLLELTGLAAELDVVG